jgi:hypothetical protein
VSGLYTQGKVLGEGGGGKVYLGQRTDAPSRLALPPTAAIKVIKVPKRRKGRPPGEHRRERALLEREVALMRALPRSPLLLQCHASFGGRTTIELVLDMCEGGSLYAYLRTHGRLKESAVTSLAAQLGMALTLLHDSGIVHRDVKPENVLLSNRSTLDIKLADFGLSCSIEDIQEIDEIAGTTEYMAPEILTRRPQDERVDIWALGVAVYELLSGTLPFNGRSERLIEEKIVKNRLTFDDRLWDSVSSGAEEFVTRCLAYWPRDRLRSGAAACSHPFLRELTAGGATTSDTSSTGSREGSAVRSASGGRRPRRAGLPPTTAAHAAALAGPLQDASGAVDASAVAPITVAELLDLHKRRQYDRVQVLLFQLPMAKRREFRRALAARRAARRAGPGSAVTTTGGGEDGGSSGSDSPPPPPVTVISSDAQLPRPSSAAPDWEPDAASDTCRACSTRFTLLQRRHHCRACGRLFCAACTSQRRPLPFVELSDKPVRVCDGCLTRLATNE